MYVITHSRDLDGWMSAAIVLKYAKEQGFDKSVDFIGWDYGDPIPHLEKGRRVIMCDISFPLEEMFKIHDLTQGSFVWIDHHASAIKEMLDNDGPAYCKSVIPAVKTKGSDIVVAKEGACELTWKYFFPDVQMPLVVEYLGCYDSFRHKGTKEEQDVLSFQYAARAYLHNYKECHNIFQYFEVFEGNYGRWISEGSVIREYLNSEAKEIYTKSYMVNIDGEWFLALNRMRFNPVNFGIDYHKNDINGFACYYHSNKGWEFSLYNDNGKVDCSEICKRRGGGGHKGAAGFVTQDITPYLEGGEGTDLRDKSGD